MQIFIQTGYPLDLPSGSLGSYCIYEYHMVYIYINWDYCTYMIVSYKKLRVLFNLQPCSMGFATGGKTFFLWGGCMMVRMMKLIYIIL